MMGQLRDRITIETESDVADDHGGFDRSWVTLATVWACVRPANAQETFFAAKRRHTVTHVIDLRFRSDILSVMRVSFDARIFHIHGILNPDARKRFTKLMVEEGVAS